MNSSITDVDALTQALRNALQLIDADDREGLRETPARYAKFFREFLTPEEFNLTTFDGEDYDEMITQHNIPFYSLCEHHMVPFFGTATISYIPAGKIVGLSKLARTLTYFSRNLQNQERITKQVADFLDKGLNPKGVGVSLTARHLCMEMRGVEKPGAQTTTTFVTGVFKTNQSTRQEFLNNLRHS